MSRLTLMFLIAVSILLAGPVPTAAAQDVEQEQSTMQECSSGQIELSVAKQMIKDGLVPGVSKTLFLTDGDIAKAKEANPELFDELVTSQVEDDSIFGTAGRGMDLAACSVLYPALKVSEKISESAFWNDPIGKFTKSVMEGNVEAMGAAMTLWMDFSTTSVNTDANVRGVKNIVMGLAGFALIASFIVGGYRIASSRRGGLQQGLEDMSDNMIRWVLFSTAVPAMVPGAMLASDALADEIMANFGATSPDAFVNLVALNETPAGPVVTLLLAGVALAGSAVQVLALVTRVLVIPIVAGLTPLFAALSFTETGRQGLNHLVAYLLAGIAFKPISALLYSVVLWNVQDGQGQGLTSAIITSVMIGLAGFTAPALIRAIVPLASQAGGGASAPLLGGAMGAVGALGGSALGSAAAMASNVGAKISSAGSSAGAGSGTSVISASGSGPGSGGGGGGPKSTGAASPGGGGAVSTQAQPSGTRSGGRVAAGALVAKGAGATARGAGAALGAGARGVQTAGRMGGHTPQRLLDESIGVPGHYAGQVMR